MATDARPRLAPVVRATWHQVARPLGWLAAALVVGGLLWLGTAQPIVEVVSPSMVPTLAVGDVALVQNLRGAAPEVGDIVAVPVPAKVQRDADYPAVVTHRVHSINDGRITTKGDNLGQPDPFDVAVSDVDRRVVTVVPGLGRLLGFLRSPFGLIWMAIGAVAFLGPMAVRAFAESAARSGTGETREPAVAPVAAADHDALLALADAVRSQGEALTELRRTLAEVAPSPAPADPPPPPPPPTDGPRYTVEALLSMGAAERDAWARELPVREEPVYDEPVHAEPTVGAAMPRFDGSARDGSAVGEWLDDAAVDQRKPVGAMFPEPPIEEQQLDERVSEEAASNEPQFDQPMYRSA